MISAANSAVNAARAGRKAALAELLALHGIPSCVHSTEEYRSRQLARTRRFVVPVFDMQALAVYRRGAELPAMEAARGKVSAYAEEDLRHPSHYARRAMRLAVKAVYAAGLDFGLVRIGVLPDGKLVVADINPAPRLKGRLAAAYAEAVRGRGEENGLVAGSETAGNAAGAVGLASGGEARAARKIMLGADPEFILRHPQGKVVAASRFMGKRGAVGCDALMRRGRETIYPLVELRPAPSGDPLELTRNLRRAMLRANRLINRPELQWAAGGMPVRGFALGGHIHISGIALTGALLRAMDNYLALPLVLLEGPTTGLRRASYGRLGDFRRKPHGGFEYRTLPSWLISPRLTAGILALALTIARHHNELRRRPLNRPQIIARYYSGDKEGLAAIVRVLWQDLERTAAYPVYRTLLDPLKNQIMQGKAWDETQDIRKPWRIPPFEHRSLPDETNQKIFMQ